MAVMTGAAVVAGIQLATLILESVRDYQEGKLTEEQLQARWDAMKLDLALQHAKAITPSAVPKAE